MPLTTDEHANIISRQQLLLSEIEPKLKAEGYEDSFFIHVHKSKEVIFAGFCGDAETTGIMLTDLLMNNPDFLNFFKACVTAAENERRKG